MIVLPKTPQNRTKGARALAATGPDPVRFRAQATGVGQTRMMSEQTGMRRSQKVIDCAPPDQRRYAIGYPKTSEEQYAAMMQPPAPVDPTGAKRGKR